MTGVLAVLDDGNAVLDRFHWYPEVDEPTPADGLVERDDEG